VPKPGRKQVASTYIRICECFPDLLTQTIDDIRLRLNKRYEDIKRDKQFRYKDNDWKRKKAVELYIENDLEALYDFLVYLNQLSPEWAVKPTLNKARFLDTIVVNKIFKRNDAYSYVAVRILSILFKSSYDKLYAIYLSERKNPKVQL